MPSRSVIHPHVVVTADGRARRRGQPARPPAERHRGQLREVPREIAGDRLEEVLRAIEVLQPVLTEIAEPNIVGQLVGNQLARGA
jgi:hypothetical protein